MNQKNNNQFCTECGTELTGGKYCQECGTKIENDKENNFMKTILKGVGITIAICVIIFIALIIIGSIIGADNYPDHAHTENIDGATVRIPAGYKQIDKAKDVYANGVMYKTAIFKNKAGQEITVGVIDRSEGYIVGHGKELQNNKVTNNPDGSTGLVLKQGNKYLFLTAPDLGTIEKMR